MEYKSVRLEEDLYNDLVKNGVYGESMSDIIRRLIKGREKKKTGDVI